VWGIVGVKKSVVPVLWKHEGGKRVVLEIGCSTGNLERKGGAVARDLPRGQVIGREKIGRGRRREIFLRFGPPKKKGDRGSLLAKVDSVCAKGGYFSYGQGGR